MTTPKPWDRDDDARRARIPVRHRDPSRPPDEGDDSLAVATDDSDRRRLDTPAIGGGGPRG